MNPLRWLREWLKGKPNPYTEREEAAQHEPPVTHEIKTDVFNDVNATTWQDRVLTKQNHLACNVDKVEEMGR